LTLDRIGALEPALVVSGHGPPIEDVATAIERTGRRFRSWLEDPVAGVMYAASRILIYRLMLEPIRSDDVRPYLCDVPWMRDLAATAQCSTDELAEQLLDALAPSLTGEGNHLKTTVPHRSACGGVLWELRIHAAGSDRAQDS
jgi:hypothetical protein